MDTVNQHSAPNFFKCLIRLLQPILLLVLWPTFSGAQNFPVQASLQIPSPHSLYLTDYTSPSYPNGIKVSLVLQDFNAQDIEVKLRFKIEGQGIVLETNLDAPLDAVTLSPGVPSFLQGADLTTNLSFQNLRLEGISSAELNRKGGRLPEGFYRVSATAFVSRRGREIPVSRPALTTLWLTEGDPPLPQESQCGIDIPFNGIEKVINFNWLPIGIHPGQGMRIFNFSLYEHPQGRPVSKAAMEETVRGTRPIYQIESVGTQLSLSTSELGLRYDPDLGASPIYIWRVQVTDSEGRTVYKNDGFSKICYFKLVEENQEWLDKMLYDSLQFKVGALNAYMGYVNFKRGNLNNALRERILFRYRGADSRDIKDWSPLEMESNNGAVINQLAPDFKYEVQMHLLSKEENVQVLTYEKKEEKAQDDGLEWSVSKTFKTFVYHEQVCGEGSKPELLDRSNRNPLMELYPKQRIQFSFGNYMTITEVTNHGGGVFSGEGLQEIFGRQVRMAFDNLMLNEDLIVLQGEAYGKQESKYKDMIAKIWQSEINRDREAEYDLNERDDVRVMPFVLRQGSISKVTVLDLGNGNQKILVFNKKGKSFNAGFPPGEGSASKKIIRDDKGNVYMVDKDGKVTKGGSGEGNTPDGSTETDSVLFVQKELIKEVLQHYKEEINLWLENNGKGPLEEALVRRLMAMPDCLPKDEEQLEAVLARIDEYLEDPGALLNLVKEDDANKTRIEELTAKLTGNQPPYAARLSETEWDELLEMVCPYLLPEEERPELVTIEPITDDQFVAGIDDDKLEITYSIKTTEKYPLQYAKLEVYKNDVTLAYVKSETIEVGEAKAFQWNGQINQNVPEGEEVFIRSDESPFTVKIIASTSQGFEDPFQAEIQGSVHPDVDAFLDNYDVAKYIEASSDMGKFEYYQQLSAPMYNVISKNRTDEEIARNFSNTLDYLGDKINRRTFLGREIIVHDHYWSYLEILDGELISYHNNADYTMGGFSIRFQRGSNDRISNHAYGMALDVNWQRNPYLSKGQLYFLQLLTDFKFYQNPSNPEDLKEAHDKLIGFGYQQADINSMKAGFEHLNQSPLKTENFETLLNETFGSYRSATATFSQLVSRNIHLRNEVHFFNRKTAQEVAEIERQLFEELPAKVDALLETIKAIKSTEEIIEFYDLYKEGYLKAYLLDKHKTSENATLLTVLDNLKSLFGFEAAIASLKEACAQPANEDYTYWVTNVDITQPQSLPEASTYQSVGTFIDSRKADYREVFGSNSSYSGIISMLNSGAINLAQNGFMLMSAEFAREFLDTGNGDIGWGGNWKRLKDFMHLEYIADDKF